MKVVKQIDDKTRLIQAGKVPNVRIELQRKKWYGWSRVNWVSTWAYNTIEEFEKLLLEDEQKRKKPYYGRLVNTEKF